MAITNADIAALPSYTDAELLVLYRWALANGAAGTSRTMGDGRSVSFPSLPDLLKAIEWLEARAASSTDGQGGNIALARFDGDPQ